MYFEYDETEVAYLRQRDARLAEVIDRVGHVEREVDPDLFSSVVHHIVGQQISTKAQATIWARLRGGLGAVNAQTVLAAGVPKLQSFGMTFRKAEYITDFAEKVASGAFDIDAVQHMPDEDAIRALSSLKGIGVWTAEMILLFCLQRPTCSASTTSRFSADCAWCITTARSRGSCLRSIGGDSARIAVWRACTCGPSPAAQSPRCATISRRM